MTEERKYAILFAATLLSVWKPIDVIDEGKPSMAKQISTYRIHPTYQALETGGCSEGAFLVMSFHWRPPLRKATDAEDYQSNPQKLSRFRISMPKCVVVHHPPPGSRHLTIASTRSLVSIRSITSWPPTGTGKRQVTEVPC